MEGKIDAIVITAGTGGTVSGIARAVKKVLPGCQIIGVDPEGSILAGPGEIKSYKVEGIGYDFIPDVLKRDLVDRWIKSNDKDSFRVARRLIRQEGLLIGGSSGSAVWAAMQVAKEMPQGSRIAVILPDSVRNYLTKFIDDRWMRESGFDQPEWAVGSIEEVMRSLPPKEILALEVDNSVGEAIRLLRQKGISQIPVTDKGILAGIVTESDLLTVLLEGSASNDSALVEVMIRQVMTVPSHESAALLPQLFDRGEVALVVDKENHVEGILTKLDLLEYLTKRTHQNQV
jgi:cystathionine beta-synthase